MRLIKYFRSIEYEKAGIVPYVYDKPSLEFLFMVPSNPRYGGNLPQIAKGVIDEGETPEQAAIREGREELGLPEEFLVTEYLFTTKFNKSKLHLYTTRLPNKDVLGIPHYETKNVVWLNTYQINNRVRPEQRRIINEVTFKIIGKEIENVLIKR